MAEIALVWYSMSDHGVTANRSQVRRWAAQFGLPPGPMSKSHNVLALRRAASEIVLDFENEGRTWTLAAEQTSRGEKSETHTLYAKPPAGKMRRVGEVKLILPRPGKGYLIQPERLKTVIAATVSDQERTAVSSWMTHFAERFEVLQGRPPQIQIRNVVRIHLVEHAIALDRHGMYFAYVDALPVVRRAGEFLKLCAPGSTFTVLPIEAGGEQHEIFAEAADHRVVTELDALMLRLETKERHHQAAKRAPTWRAQLDTLAQVIADHERRLGVELVQSRTRLDLAYQAVSRIDPTADLLRVIR